MRTVATGPRSERRASIAATLRTARPAGSRLVAAAALGAAAVSASVALLAVSTWLVSRAAQHPPEAALALAIVAVQFFGLSRGFLRYGERIIGHDAALRELAVVRSRFFETLERLAPAGLPQFRRADLLSRMVGDVDSLQDVPLRVIQPFAVAVVVGTAVVTASWVILPGAGLALLVAVAAAALLVPLLTAWRAHRSESRLDAERAELNVAVLDLVDGSAELIAMGGTAEQVGRISASDQRLRRISRRAASTSGLGLGLVTLLTGSACWASLAIGVGAVDRGRLSGVLLGAVVVLPLAAFESLAALPAVGRALSRCRGTTGRVLAVSEAVPAVMEPEAPGTLAVGARVLELRSVTAGYPGRQQPVLRDVDLRLAPGRRLALVGESGAGKSTLAAVLVRFLSASDGHVTLDGRPVDACPGDDVRRVVGLVEQAPHLFNDTLANNLRLARTSATDAELWAALLRVGLAEWGTHLPRGLATDVGRFGTQLSGGQRQRIAVARALLADFPILVLDEPTEHLDDASADRLLDELLAPHPARSTLLITHRLRGLFRVDEILVLEGGRIVERGSHRSLIRAGGRYARRWGEEVEAGALPSDSLGGARRGPVTAGTLDVPGASGPVSGHLRPDGGAGRCDAEEDGRDGGEGRCGDGGTAARPPREPIGV